MSNETVKNDTLTSYPAAPVAIVETYVIPVVFGLTCVVGLIGNALVIYVVLKERKMKTTTNLFILNLSVADFLFLILFVPFTAVGYATVSWPFGRFMCKITNYLQFVNLYASVYTLLVMSIDRFLAVVYPIRSMKIRNVRNATGVVVTMWGVVVVVLSPILTKFTTVTFRDPYGRLVVYCVQTFSASENKLFWVQLFFTSYFLPLVVITITYFLLLKRLWTGVVPQGANTQGNVKQKKKVTRMVVIVVIIFCVCWMPIQVIVLSITLGWVAFSDAVQIAIWVGNIMSYANSCVNPIIYAFLSDNFRKSFQKVFRCYPGKAQIEFDRTDGRNSDNSPAQPPATSSR